MSRTRCSAQQCTADAGPRLLPAHKQPGSRVCSASLRAALRPGRGRATLMNALTAPFRRPHHVSLLRCRMRRAGAAGSAGRRHHQRRPGPSGEFRPAMFERIRARRNARSRRTAAASDAAAVRWIPRRRRLASGARPRSGRTAAGDRAPRAGRGRVLSLGPAPHRGLLRRQQADERVHRLGQRRYQFAPVHGLDRRRTHPRLRRRRRARHLRGSRSSRPDRAHRLERRMVPSGALPAHDPEPQ